MQVKKSADEGFLLFYVSPRLSVNEDTINKFKDKSGHLFADDLYCIYTSRAIIFGNNDQPTVRYYSNCNNKNFERPGVTFFGAGDDEKRITTRRKQISRLSSNSLCYDRQSGTGVIRSLCDAGHALMKEGVNKSGEKHDFLIVQTFSLKGLIPRTYALYKKTGL